MKNFDHIKPQLKNIAFILNEFELKNGFLVLPYKGLNPIWHSLYENDVSEIEVKTFILIASIFRVGKELSQEESEKMIIGRLTSLQLPELQNLDFQPDVEVDYSEDEKQELVDLFRNLFEAQIALVMNYMSSMVYGVTINELLFSNEKPLDKQLKAAVRIDKTLIGHDLLKTRISNAQMNGDQNFLNSLGSNLSKPNFHSNIKYPLVYFAFYILERDKLIVDGKMTKQLTAKILLDLLEECGFFTDDKRIPSEKQLRKTLYTYHQNKRNPF